MSNRVKTMLWFFLDYGFCILCQLIGVVLLSWAFKFSWAGPVYSIFFCILLICRFYIRGKKAAKKDMWNHDKEPSAYEGLLMVLPIVLVHLAVIIAYELLKANIIPFANVLTETVYSFPVDAQRVVREIFLPEALVPYLRIWFGSVMGFMGSSYKLWLACLVPVMNLVAAFGGYLAALKKFYIADFLLDCWDSIIERFND